MAQIEMLNKMLFNMEQEIIKLEMLIKEKTETIHSYELKIEELNTNLTKEKELLTDALKKKDQMSELKEEVNMNYNQINQGVDNLVNILKNNL